MKTKTQKPFSKVLAGLLSFALAFTMLPSMAFASDGAGETPSTDDGLVLNKTATLEDDGTYTIDLEAYATGETMTVMQQDPTDIVLVLDVSGSMKEQLDDTVFEDGYVPATGKVSDMPSDVYHHCADGTYSTIKWKDERTGTILKSGHIRFTCDHCNVTRSLKYTGGVAYPSTIEGQDGWALYKKGSHKAYKMEVLQLAAKQFIEEVAARNAAIDDPNNQHQVAIVKFASAKTDVIGNDIMDNGYNYSQIVEPLTVVNSASADDMKTEIDKFSAAGATSVDYGMEHAQSILDPVRTEGRKQVVIVFTDGEPTHSNKFEADVANSAITTAKALKGNGVSIYTIGVFDGADPTDTKTKTNAYMNALSSNYPEATAYTALGTGSNKGYYKVAKNTAELTSIFKGISQDVNFSNVKLNADAVIKDVMGEGFVLTDKSQAEAYSVPYTGKDAEGNRTFGATKTSYNAVISKDDNSVSVTGFDYSTKYLVDSNPVTGEKLVVTITGVLPTDAAVTNEVIDTNDTIHSGIYANSNELLPVKEFPQPKTILTSKAYVLDYAKPFTMSASDWKQTSTTLYDSFEKADPAPKYGSLSESVYTPTTTEWDGYDNFYALGKTDDAEIKAASANANGNLWSKVSVIPANNVYYEDDFETNDSGTVGIEYTGEWTTEGTPSGNTETPNGEEHGWEASLADDATYSDGSAHKVTVTDETTASATFTFTGTGVDIYTKTDMETGTVFASCVASESNKTPVSKYLIVDNYAESDDNKYQIPTLSFDMGEYGTYTVTIYVTTAAEGRSTYYIDGIRVYNPLNPENIDETVIDSYGDEMGAAFTEVRDRLLAAKDLDVTSTEEGIVFIDNGSEGTFANYESDGPENEVYLAKGQMIAFKLGGYDASTQKISVGLKAPSGKATQASVSANDKRYEYSINAASDLYYEVVPSNEGIVVIQNTGDELLAVTKLKSTEDLALERFSVSYEDISNYAATFSALPVAVKDTDSDASVTEPTDPEESGEVIIENPEPETKPSTDLGVLRNLIKQLFDGFRILLGR